MRAEAPLHRTARIEGRIAMIGAACLALALASTPVVAGDHAPSVAATSVASASADAAAPSDAATAAIGTQPVSDAATTAAETADLQVFNRTVFTFRSNFLGIAPAQRARAAQERIDRLLDQSGPIEATVEAAPQGAIVRLNGVFGFVATPRDVDPDSDDSALDAGRQAVAALATVIAETREVRDLHSMLNATAYAIAASALFGAIVWCLRRARSALTTRLSIAASRHAEQTRVQGIAIVQRDLARRLVGTLVAVFFWAILFVAAYEWLGFVLSSFPYTRVWGQELTAFLLGTLRDMLAATVHAVPGLAIALTIFVIARAVARGTSAYFRRVQSGRLEVGWLDADTARPTQQLVSILIWLFALVMAYPYLPGSNTDAFKGVSVLVGLMVSLGASSVVAQGASGLILMYTRTLRPGEFVRIGEHEGTVVELGTFATRIRTGLGQELTLPSAVVLGSVTTNYSRTVKGDGFVVDATVTIGYDTPWRQVHAMLIEAARSTPGVLEDPAPRVFQTDLSDFYVAYRLVCQAIPSEPRPRAEVISLLNARIQDVFNQYGVQIMSPHYLGDPPHAKVVPRERWHAAPAQDDSAV